MLVEKLNQHQSSFKNIVEFDKNTDQFFAMKLSKTQLNIPIQYVSCNDDLSNWLHNYLKENNFKYAIGGYNELRDSYSKSSVFDADAEPRRLHLGIDIWAAAGTAVYLPIDGKIHSYANNKQFGDYGPTVIFEHHLEGYIFHTLYGHLSEADLLQWQKFSDNKIIKAGTLIAHMGHSAENVGWSPHVHFQIIIDMQGKKGDYFGVCSNKDKEFYLQNCPNPNLILGFKGLD